MKNQYETEMGIGNQYKVAFAMSIAIDAMSSLLAWVASASREEIIIQLNGDRDKFVDVDIHDSMAWMKDDHDAKGWQKLAPESAEYILAMANRMHHSNVEALAVEFGIQRPIIDKQIVIQCGDDAEIMSVDANIPSVALMSILSDAIDFIHR